MSGMLPLFGQPPAEPHPPSPACAVCGVKPAPFGFGSASPRGGGGAAVSDPIVIGDCALYTGDCLEIMPTLGGIDHIISDPPYEDELHKAVGKFKILRNDNKAYYSNELSSLGFEGINATRTPVAAACVSASSGWLILFTLAEGVRAWRDDIQAAGAKYDTCLAWVKPDASPRFNGQGAAHGFECAITAWCGAGHRRWNGGGRRGVFTHCVNVGRQGEHPTEKPLPLMMDLVSLYTNPGDLVCDPFCGSGTTGVACARLGRRFIGIDTNPRWIELSRRRIDEVRRQPDLFIQPNTSKRAQSSLFESAADRGGG